MKSILTSASAVLVALASCTCCIGPLMALAGMIGVSASQLIWLASIKNYLIAFSLLAIGFNLHRAYFPKKEETCCVLEGDEEWPKLNENEQKAVSIFQSKSFLWSIAILTIIILLLPYINL